MRREEIRAGAFADPLAHPAYLHRLVARAASLSSLLLQDLLICGQHTDSVVENELAPTSQCRQRLFFGSRCRLRVLALGGGPGFEGVAIASLAEFFGSTLDEIDIWIADYERSWERTAAAVHRAFEATRAEQGRRTAVRVTMRFISADVTRGLGESCNGEMAAVLGTGVDLVVCSHVLVETAAAARARGWDLLVELAARMPVDSYLIALDATHRCWPEVVEALRRGRPATAAWLPRPTNRIALLARFGAPSCTLATAGRLALCHAAAGAAHRLRFRLQTEGDACAAAGGGKERRSSRAAPLSGGSTPPPQTALLAEDEAQALTHGIDVRGLRAAMVIRFSVAAHPLRAAVVHCLRLVASGTDDDTALLEALHSVPISAQAGRLSRSATQGCADSTASRQKKKKGPGARGPSSFWMSRWKQSCARGPDLPAELKAAHAAFDAAYVDFVRDVVLPNLADPRGILFQRRPTFRCHLAGGGVPTGRPHCDSEYGHQHGELNFWLPLTRASGSNSLYAESAPGLADFASFELEYGECQRFWGARCLHFTKANETSRTRVSFDFRVVPRSCHVERPCDRGFGIGFYTAMDAQGRVG